MERKAVIFDLFETLITEWGHKKYTKNEMCADLGLERGRFDAYWDEKEAERYIGEISFPESILYVCGKCGKPVDDSTLSLIIRKRTETKSLCFEHVHPDVYGLLDRLKAAGYKLAIPKECVFVGDGGSNELPGARAAGMEAIQAKWYTNELPHRRDSLPGFLTAEEPFDILRYFEKGLDFPPLPGYTPLTSKQKGFDEE